jgi:hypothetical protein
MMETITVVLTLHTLTSIDSNELPPYFNRSAGLDGFPFAAAKINRCIVYMGQTHETMSVETRQAILCSGRSESDSEGGTRL